MLKEQINSAQMSDEHFAQRSNAIREEIESRQDQKQDLQEEEKQDCRNSYMSGRKRKRNRK